MVHERLKLIRRIKYLNQLIKEELQEPSYNAKTWIKFYQQQIEINQNYLERLIA